MPEEQEEKGFAAGIGKAIAVTFDSAMDKINTVLTNFPEFILFAINTFFEGMKSVYSKPVWDMMLNSWVKKGIITEEDKEHFYPIQTGLIPIDIVVSVAYYIMVEWKHMSTHLDISTHQMQKNMATALRPALADPTSLVHSAFIAPEKMGLVEQTLREQGFSEEQIDLLFVANYRMYDVGVIRNLYLRKAITEDKMFERMREHGFTDTRIKEMIQSWQMIPGASDMFHLVAKEAFEPTAIKELGLLEEFPEEQIQWLEAQGISKYWAEKYWIAHWIPPSIGQTFEMLHRGLVDDEFVDAMFKVHEIPPGARVALKGISYHPFTRVDVRRMHKSGVIDDEELIRAYQDAGYDREKSEKMSEFTKVYNQETEKELTRAQILRGYTDMGFTAEETVGLLISIGYNKDLSEYYVALEDSKELQSDIDEEIKLIAERFQGNLIEESNTRKALLNLGIAADRTEKYIHKWKTYKMLDIRLPSKTDLLKMYKAKVITKDRYYQELRKLGYSAEYADWYVRIA